MVNNPIMEQKLVTTQRTMERKMFHLSLKDTSQAHRNQKITQVKDISERINASKWKWAGHISRTEDNRWTKRLTEWQTRTGKRRR